MGTDFRIMALPSEPFEPLFRMSDAEVRAAGGRRMVADEKPGFPCRVSLADAEVGETVLLLPFTHHDVASPYRHVHNARPGCYNCRVIGAAAPAAAPPAA